MTIYYITHATSIDNEAGIASGWNDVALSALGVEQAEARRADFEDIHIDKVFCSDLKRAVDTARIAFGNALPITTDDRLRELNYGDLNGASKHMVEGKRTQYLTKPFPNGESYRQGLDRTEEFCSEVERQHPDKTIIIVGHRLTYFSLEVLVNRKSFESLMNEPFAWQPYWMYDWQSG